MPAKPWPPHSPTHEHFRDPPREYGILPFWFLNGELDPDEMRWQLGEFRDKGIPGIILHGRFGLEHPYLGPTYRDRIRFAVEEAERLGMTTWVYDEMNWPSGTADFRVVRERPDLAQRYIECLSFPVRGPWFSYLTGGDSRYIDFERSTPVAAFAIGEDGRVLDLTPNLSFENVIPWEAPPGNWRLMYLVEKRADYYIDALDPEATAEFLRLGYEPYAATIGDKLPTPMVGFYTDEPAMHYYVSGGDNPIVPWTKDMFRRFHARNGYDLRPRLPDLFFDLGPDSARVRYDFYTTLTAFYSDAYFRQIHDWCQERGLLFTGHLLYEEWLRKMIRVAGNPFRHYPHLDVVGVDHLYPFIGGRDRPDEHVAMKLASSAAHQLGSDRVLCESFGGIFMDATMQRMKWLTDWQHALGVNLINPHGFHYTLEGPRKRDWPPSMFYQYPWWRYYAWFSAYVARLGAMLTGGHHVAKVAVLWPINAMFGTYTPQQHHPLGDRTEHDFNALTDLLLRLHHDYDYLDEDVLADAEIDGGMIRIRDEVHHLVVLPPMTHLKLATLERLERFVAGGGRLLGTVFLPDRAYGDTGLVDIAERVERLFGIDPAESQRTYREWTDTEVVERDHPGGGKTAFVKTYALARQLPLARQREVGAAGLPEHAAFGVETAGEESRYWFTANDGSRHDVTDEVKAEREGIAGEVQEAIAGLITPDVVLDNPEVFCLHRVKDGRDLYFLANPTFAPQAAEVTLSGAVQPLLWDPSTGEERHIAPSRVVDGATQFHLDLPPVGSAFVTTSDAAGPRIIETNIVVDGVSDGSVVGHARGGEGYVVLERGERRDRIVVSAPDESEAIELDGEWAFSIEGPNALVIGEWLASTDAAGDLSESQATAEIDPTNWLRMVPGAWSYQLPTEPSRPYPIDVWYRVSFHVVDLPARLDLIADGWAGASWTLLVNGRPVTTEAVRSPIDSQMKAIDITDLARQGENVIALRLSLTSPTDGLLDLVKLTGDFSLVQRDGGGHAIAAPRRTVDPGPWTAQGYPFLSGVATYRRGFRLPDHLAGQRVELEASLADDVLEVLINGQSAGVRLWPPYSLDITDSLRPGENEVELRVANTPANLLNAVERPSGLTGAPRLVPYRQYRFEVQL